MDLKNWKSNVKDEGNQRAMMEVKKKKKNNNNNNNTRRKKKKKYVGLESKLNFKGETGNSVKKKHDPQNCDVHQFQEEPQGGEPSDKGTSSKNKNTIISDGGGDGDESDRLLEEFQNLSVSSKVPLIEKKGDTNFVDHSKGVPKVPVETPPAHETSGESTKCKSTTEAEESPSRKARMRVDKQVARRLIFNHLGISPSKSSK